MKILCRFDGHNFQIVAGSEYRSSATAYFGDKPVTVPYPIVGFTKRCKRCGYENTDSVLIPGSTPESDAP